MAFALDTSNFQLQIKDTEHIINKDTRTLFAYDNLKYEKYSGKKQADIPELHLLSYYGDITGPTELRLRNECMKLLKSHLENLDLSLSENQTSSNMASTLQSMFHPDNIEIMHISHRSSEFVFNVSNTPFLDEYKSTDTNANHYLVATYQESAYSGIIEQFLTIGITKTVSNSTNAQLYRFYVDDLIQDLYKILYNTSWYDKTCELPLELLYVIAHHTVDCLLPIKYTRSIEDEILLNDGKLHVFMTGELNVILNNNNDDDDSGERKSSDDIKESNSTLEIMAKTCVDLGSILHKNKNKIKNKLKSEYDTWKKQGFKKRVNLKPLTMNELTSKLHIQQQKRQAAINIATINRLKYLYYKNPNFKLTFNKSKSNKKMQSFKNFFSFGNKKNKHSKALTQMYPTNINLLPSQTDEITYASEAVEISRSQTEPFNNKKRSKNKKHKQKNRKLKNRINNVESNNNNIYIPSKMKQTVSVPPFSDNINSAKSESASMSRSKSSGYTKKKIKNAKRTGKNNKKRNYMTIDMLYNSPSNDTMDDNDGQLQLVLPDTSIEDTQSADSVFMNMKRTKSGKLTPTLKKPQQLRGNKGKSVDVPATNYGIHSNKTNVSNNTISPYSHDENKILYLDYADVMNKAMDNVSVKLDKNNNNKHKRQESNTDVKLKQQIRVAYKNYEKDKGKIPDDIQAFLMYCKKKNNIKKANWTRCEYVMNEMKVNVEDTIFE